MEWNRFVDWWETLGSYPPPGTSLSAFSEEIAHEIVTRWKEISKKVNKEFLKDFDNYHIVAFQDRVFVSQTRFIPGGPGLDELYLLKAEAANKLVIEFGATRERAEKLVGFKEKYSKSLFIYDDENSKISISKFILSFPFVVFISIVVF